MKNAIKYMLMAAAAATVFAACSDWTEYEPKNPTDLTKNENKEDYYANLRAYRNSDHQIMYGYFSAWGGWGGASTTLAHSLMGLPDSLDMVAMWGAGFEYSEEQKIDLKMAHEKKGLKCLMCFIVHSVGVGITPSEITAASETNPVTFTNRNGVTGTYTNPLKARRAFWGMDPDDGRNNTPEMDAMAVRAVETYADSLCYLIDKLELDGFDWDFEYGYSVGDNVGDIIGDQGTITSTAAHDRSLAFARRMRENLGDKIFIIDGVPQSLQAPEACIYFDYFAHQSYSRSSSRSDNNLDNLLNQTISRFSAYLDPEFIASRTIVMDTFEDSYTYDGKQYFGVPLWSLRDGTPAITADCEFGNTNNGMSKADNIEVQIPGYEGSVFAMARWTPIVNGKYVRKGGIGAYLLEKDYMPSGWDTTYPQVRQFIQIMNPAAK